MARCHSDSFRAEYDSYSTPQFPCAPVVQLSTVPLVLFNRKFDQKCRTAFFLFLRHRHINVGLHSSAKYTTAVVAIVQ